MACGSGITSLVMVAGGAMVTNGALSGTFGAAPLSSLASAPLSLTDVATGLSNFAPTLNTMVSGITAITGAGAPLAGLSGALSAIEGAGFTDNMITAFNNIPGDLGVGGGLFDAIGGFAPSVNNLLTTASGGLTTLNKAFDYAGDWAGQTLGGTGIVGGLITGDPGKFGTILSAASGYVDTANQFINAATNSDILGTTFNGLDNIISGGLADVNINLSDFGADLANIGNAINFDSLSNLGSPGQLLANLDLQGNLGPLYDQIAEINIDADTARSIGASLTGFVTSELEARGGSLPLKEFGLDIGTIARQGADLPANFQQAVYETLDELDPTAVAQVKGILGNAQDTVVKATDLLDPKKIFPNSFDTFTTPLRTASVGFRAIYEEDGSINPQLNNLGDNLRGIVPDDVAVANDALSRSLRQVKNIQQTTSTGLGSAVADLETLKDLDLIQNQTQLLPAGVKNYWLQQYGVDTSTNVTLATGNAGQITLSDVIGFAAGYNSAAPLTKNSQLLATMSAAGELDAITGSQGIYDTINQFCAGTFGPVNVPPWTVTITAGYVGAGTYTGASSDAAFEDAWVNGIVPAIKTILASYTSNTRAVEIMTNSERWNNQLAREYLNQSRIDNVDLSSVPSSQTNALQLAQNLPNFGLDTAEGGTGELLERIVDFSSLGGQAIIAAMREGRNLQRLANANVEQDTSLDTDGVQDSAQLTTSQYTKAEAQNRVIRT